MSHLISVIIPAYNVENYIERCINSVLNQTYFDLEIIVINDGSTDGTKKILNAFQNRDNRLKIIHKENTGVSDTRNVGLQVAKGNFIGFIDSDDEVKTDMYSILLSNLITNQADISHCGFEYVTPSKTKIFNETNITVTQSREEALTSLLKGHLFEPSSCTKLYRKTILVNVFFDQSIKFNEDLLFNIKAFKNAKKIVFQDISLYRYILNSASASKNTNIYEIQQSVLQVAHLSNGILQGLDLDAMRNYFYVNKLISIYRALHSENLLKTPLGLKVKELLIYSSNSYLDIRTVFLKYSLVYFLNFYKCASQLYDKTIGKNKRWEG